MQEIFIVAAARTPVGSFLGSLAPLSAPRLGAAAIAAALQRAALSPDAIDQVIMGNVLQAGVGQAPARQAGIYGGLLPTTGAITVNKVCGSGLRAVMDAANGIRTGEWAIVIAGGMESMSNAPHLLEGSRSGQRMGAWQAADALLKDGLLDAYSGRPMGLCAEACAKKFDLSRAQQDDFARDSYHKARAAHDAGHFHGERVAVEVPRRKGEPLRVEADEEPFAAPLDKMAQLRPAFAVEGSITAANASKVSDGAAAVVVMSAQRAEDLGKTPLGRIVAYATAAQEPEWFTTAPQKAVRLCLQRAGLSTDDIDAWEINEAFAVVTLAAIAELGLDAKKVNRRGGAIALGHPLGASGARLLTTLLAILNDEKKRYGCVVLCIGGGEAAALIVENMNR